MILTNRLYERKAIPVLKFGSTNTCLLRVAKDCVLMVRIESKNVDITFLFGFGIGAPPSPDRMRYKGKSYLLSKPCQIFNTDFFKYLSHVY